MKVEVRYFAGLREALGAAETVDVPAGSTVGALRQQLCTLSSRHADLLAPGRAVRCALNQVMSDESALVPEVAEVAFFPPSPAAEAHMPCVSIQHEDFDLGVEVAALRAGDGGVGAVASFIGTVRGQGEGAGVGAMELELELEHYPGMTERAITAMIDEARQRFDIRAARVVHRVGRLAVGEQIVLVAVTSAHRGQAFQACEFLMDYLKTQAPFWKKEHTPEGARWVDARVADDAALRRWGVAAGNVA